MTKSIGPDLRIPIFVILGLDPRIHAFASRRRGKIDHNTTSHSPSQMSNTVPFDPQARLHALLAKAAALTAVRCAVVHPCDTESLSGALEAARRGITDCP